MSTKKSRESSPLNSKNASNQKDQNDETNSQSKTSSTVNKERNNISILNKKTKRSNLNKKENRELCAICRDGGDLLLCDNCPRSFHLSCLKLKEEDIPEGNWYCSRCAPKMQKKLEKNNNNIISTPEDKERERKRLLKNEKRRLWRLKKKAESLKNKNLNLVNKDGNLLIDSFLKGNINYENNKKISLDNSNICLNFTYTLKNVSQSKSLSLPILFPIPNTILEVNEKNINDLNQIYRNNKCMNKIISKISNSDLIDVEFNNDNKENENIQKINSVNSLNELISKDKKNIKIYGDLIRNYWENVLQKKSSRHSLKYPIEDNELYMFPDIYNLEDKYYNKPKGHKITFIDNNNFSDLIQIYDFISTFSHKIYLSEFSIEDLYSALSQSINYKESEITLLSSIHISLLFILINELSTIPLLEIYNNSDIELLLVKINSDYFSSDNKKLYGFIYQTWIELIRLIFSSITLNKFTDDNLEGIIKKLSQLTSIIDYNTSFSYDEKILILKGLIYNCYETKFIRNTIKEEQEKRDKIKKKKKELEEDLKDTEQKKRELERQEQYTQPQIKIEQLNKKLLTLSEDNQNMSRHELAKLRKRIEKERDEFKSVIKEINSIENKRDELINKIENIKNDIHNIPTIGKKLLGSDGRKYKYYFFPWMNGKIYIKICNNNDKIKYEWREIDSENEIKNLIETLSDKGIKENNLKNKIKRFLPKKNSKHNNNELTNIIIPMGMEENFQKKVLNYINYSNPLRNVENNKNEFITNNINQYDLIYERLYDLEKNITNYLSNDNKEWESFEIRDNIKTWISCINNINEYVNLLKMFNERVKSPYKINSNLIKVPNKKIIDDENIQNEDSPIDINGHLDYMKINKNLELGNKAKLWSKEFESYSLETIYLQYLDEVKNFPMLHFSIDIFEVILYDLNKRRDFYKKRNEELLIDMNQNKIEKKEEDNDIRKKRKKMIDWNDKCLYCNEYGDLICCEDCPNVAHLSCAQLKKEPEIWRCPECLYKLSNRRLTRSSYIQNK